VRPHGFPPALRVLRKRDFDAAFREGASAADDRMVLHLRPNGLPHPRLGLAVGKALGGAVARNRVKRLLREAFRLHRGDLPAGHDLVVVARPGEGEWTLEGCAASLRALSARAADRLARGGGRRARPPGPRPEEPRP